MDDREMVRTLLGREPRGAFEVVVRDERGWPVVIRNAPLLDDGTPMPTRYWLVGEDAVRRVGHLEAAGGVREAERTVDPAELADAHARHARERDQDLPVGHVGHRPSGGVGGTREGVKCLHAHYAWFLAGGDDPVGRWVDERLRGPALVAVELDHDRTTVVCAAPEIGSPWQIELPVGLHALMTGPLGTSDPPAPEDLTNAIGAVEDHLDDVRRAHPELVAHEGVRIVGPLARTIARIELGRDQLDHDLRLGRDAAEDVFRTMVTESRVDRAHNPGLPGVHVDEVVAAVCILVAVMRRLHLVEVTIEAARVGHDTDEG
jgi:uncharacterized protein